MRSSITCGEMFRALRRAMFPVGVILAAAALLLGCDLPKDGRDTLERARGNKLRVGIVDSPPWVRISATEIRGIEPALIRAWAGQIGARIEWRPGGVGGHVLALEHGEIDLLVAGLTSRTPYASRLGLSRPYLSNDNQIRALTPANQRPVPGGRVIAVAPGESAALYALDRFLLNLGKDRIREVARREGSAKAQQ